MLQRTRAIEETLLDMLAQQVRHYLKGPYAGLDPQSLSLAAVLRDGYAAKMLVEIYLMHDSQTTPRSVVERAVMKHSDLTLGGDALSACSLQSKAAEDDRVDPSDSETRANASVQQAARRKTKNGAFDSAKFRLYVMTGSTCPPPPLLDGGYHLV